MENVLVSVLLVEDDEEDALLIREWLDEGHTAQFSVAWVRTAVAAIQAVGEQRYDVILVDYRLGLDSGVELIRALVSGGCQAPVILLTGVGSYVIDAQAIEAGAADYLPKTQLNTELLERSIQHALAHRRTQTALQERIQLAAFNAEVNAALVQGGQMRDMLQHCAEAMIRHLDAAFARIWLLDPETHTLELQASAGENTRLDGPYSRVALGQFKIGRIAQERRPYLSQVQIKDLHRQGLKEAPKQSLSFAGYPLVTKDKVLGVIALFARYPLTQVTLQKIAVVVDAIVVGIERRQAQDELGASELRWRTLTEALPQLVWTCRIDGSCDYLNQQWLLYTGVSLDELLGWGWTQTVHPDDVSLVRAKWSTVVEAREIFEMEYRLRSKDGNYRWFKARGIPLHDTITNTIKWFGVTSDIQDQKLAQETLQTARDELERRVQERTAELREMNEALRSEITERVRAEEALHRSERLAMLTTAATKLAHEIGNPLNGLSTTVQIMERFLKKQSPSEDESLDAFLQDLRAEIARLQSLVQNWRSLSSMTRIDLRPHSLSRLVADVLRSQVQYYTELGIILCESIPPDLPPILADANSLAQVILNLSKNAIEAMPGGGTLTLDAARKEDQVVLHISDSGKGIPESLNIFEPFTTTKENGTGLGLAIVQQVISAHGGTITYRSTPGEGTTFTLTLAVAPTENENSFASRSHV